MKKTVLVLLGLLASLAATAPTTAAAAGFVNDRTAWLGLTLEAKLGYIQALNDSVNYIYADDTLADALAKRGRTQCLIAQKATAAILADRLTMAYKDERVAKLPPSAVFIMTMTDVCKAYINQARLEFGLGPQ